MREKLVVGKHASDRLGMPEWITIFIIVQTFFSAVEIVPGINLIFQMLKLPVLLAFWLMMLYVLHIKIQLKWWMIILVLWVWMMLLLSVLGSGFARGHLVVDSSFVLYGLLLVYYNRDEKRKYCELFYWTILICFMLTCVYSIFQIEKYPVLARALASGSEEAIRKATGGKMVRGVGGYETVYGFILMIPMVMSSMKKEHGVKRCMAICTFFAGMIYILKAQYTIAILFFLVAVLLSCLHIKKMYFLVVAGAAAVLLMIETGLATDFLRGLMRLFSDSELIMARLNQMIGAIEKQSLAEIDRMALYEWNVKSILSNPFGNIWSELRAEPVSMIRGASDSEWLYMFSYFGIPISLIMLLFWYVYKKESTAVWTEQNGKLVMRNTWILFVTIGLVNTLLRATVCPAILLFVLPCFCLKEHEKTVRCNHSTKSGI